MDWTKRTVLINIAVFIGLIIMLNILSFTTIKIYQQINGVRTVIGDNDNSVYTLPNYSNYKKEDLTKLWNESFDSTHNYHYKSFVEYQALPYTGDHINIGDDGYRHNGIEIDDNKKSIFLFGGSTMFGVGVSDNYTIPAYLYRKLNGQFNVYNYGVSGHNSRNEVANLVNYINKNGAPDFVIFYDGVNDVLNSCSTGDANSTVNEKLIRKTLRKSQWEINPIIHRLYKIFFMYTELMVHKVNLKIFDNTNSQERMNNIYRRDSVKDSNAFYQKKMNSKEPNNMELNNCKNDKYATEVANTLINNWVIAKNIVTNMDGEFFSILQPEIYIGKPRKDHLNLNEVSDNSIAGHFNKIYPIIQNSIRKYNYMHDMTNAFDTNDYIYRSLSC